MGNTAKPWGGWKMTDLDEFVRLSIQEAASAVPDVEYINEQLEDLSSVAYPSDAVVVKISGGDYTSLKSAVDAVNDATSTNRKTIIVSGDVTESGAVTWKNYVDVIFEPKSRLILTNTSAEYAITFDGVTDTRWVARTPKSSTVIRVGINTNRTACFTVINGSETNNLYMHGITFESYIPEGMSTVRCMAAMVGYGTFENCVFLANSEMYTAQRSYGCAYNGGYAVIKNCLAKGGYASVVSAGFAGGDSGVQGHKLINCIAYGGISGNESNGIWTFSYGSSDNNGIEFIDCVAFAGEAPIAHGISAHKSSNARFYKCVGYSNPNGTGSGIFSWGQPDNRAYNTFIKCIGIGRGTATPSHGLQIFSCARDKFIDCTFIGSSNLGDSCGAYIEYADDTISDNRKLTFIRCDFIGGGVFSSLQSRSTQYTFCYALNAFVQQSAAPAGIDFINCNFFSNENSNPVGIEAALAALTRFFGGTVMSEDETKAPFVTFGGTWFNADIYEMVLVGNMDSETIEPASPTTSGTNTIII